VVFEPEAVIVRRIFDDYTRVEHVSTKARRGRGAGCVHLLLCQAAGVMAAGGRAASVSRAR
jgi:hypothetical protein